MEVYFVRHGKTEWNERGLFQGRADIPLSEAGYAEAVKSRQKVLRKKLSFDRVISSPLCRAQETAAIISGFPKEALILDERLSEMDFGVMDGTNYYTPDYPGCERAEKPFGGFFEDPEQYDPPEGAESFDDLYERVRSFLEELTQLSEKDDAPQTVLVAAHGWVLRMAFRILLALPLSQIRQLKVPNGRLMHFTFEDGCAVKRPDPFREADA